MASQAQVCADCRGYGHMPITCPLCYGQGKVVVHLSVNSYLTKCSACQGRGTMKLLCDQCYGTGRPTATD